MKIDYVNLLLIIGIAGWLVCVYAFTYIRQLKQRHFCPRCGAEWKQTGNIADHTFVCKKCGMTTYDNRKYNPIFEEKSRNY